LIAFGVFQMTNVSHFLWSYLFWIEGSLSLAVAILAFFVLPKNSQTAWFLNDAEKSVAELRLKIDSLPESTSKINWHEAFSEFRTPHPYIRAIVGLAGAVLLTANANFLAIIVSRLGYSTVKTNLVKIIISLNNVMV
jgi:hypothetical protein